MHPIGAPLYRRWGLILYRTHLAADALDKDSQLDLGLPVHDYASVSGLVTPL